MVYPVSNSTTSYPTPQPSFSAGAETRINTERAQPRQAPAAESQRGDQKLNNREDDTRRTEERQASQSARSSRGAESSRGSQLDVSV